MPELNIPNLNKLIAHLEAQPPERINMGWVEVASHGHCGTCGCIKGHADLLFGYRTSLEAIGLKPGQNEWDDLVCPEGWTEEQDGLRRYPAHRVIATLKRLRDHYLTTGEVKVDWGPEPGAEPAQPRSAPLAVETTIAPVPVIAPELPAEITALLHGGKVEA